ncbi:MAG: precorrin-2 C(20)-methyltransferase [Proteobacteria bacterium]|nr:precorrin-2 C(20)-methyltransferase [Pseudomonadota bacterium]
MNKQGTLYGIGVGPGDPELMTIKAVRIMSTVDVVFTASSTKNSFSLAVDIARPHLPDTVDARTLSFPMTKDKDVMKAAWKENAQVIVGVLNEGKDAAFLTLGDPMTYSTFGYILQELQESNPEVAIVTIPGITSYQAAAARMNVPLVEAEESLLLTSGAYGGANIRKLSDCAENVVLLKAYKNVKDITKALEESDMLTNSRAIKKCGREGEEIITDITRLGEGEPDYWTLILAKQNRE